MERRVRGAALNQFEGRADEAIDARRRLLETQALDARLATERTDVTLPPPVQCPGLIHPIQPYHGRKWPQFFGAMGFAIAEGPDVEDDWRNFGGAQHSRPSLRTRGMDTFYVPGVDDRRSAACCAPHLAGAGPPPC